MVNRIGTQGCEWVIEAAGCPPEWLQDPDRLRALFDDVIAGMGLTPVALSQWHQFPSPGGITGLCLLQESHLACHTFPEYGTICLNVFCCRPRDPFPFEAYLREQFGAREVRLRLLERTYGIE